MDLSRRPWGAVVTFEIGFSFEHDAFTTKGPTPSIGGWVHVRRSHDHHYGGFRKGFEIAFGLRPLRFAWARIWRFPKASA